MQKQDDRERPLAGGGWSIDVQHATGPFGAVGHVPLDCDAHAAAPLYILLGLCTVRKRAARYVVMRV
jgi:hypothetical protein